MSPGNYVRLARYHGWRGVRMLKCAKGVESCGHHKAFLALAGQCFEASDYCMRIARAGLGKRKVFVYLIEDVSFEGRVMGEFDGFDELGAGAAFEKQCESVGVDPGMYRVTLLRRKAL